MMLLRICVAFLVSIASLCPAMSMADEADWETVLQRLDEIQDSLTEQEGMFTDRFGALEREVGALHRLPSVHHVSLTDSFTEAETFSDIDGPYAGRGGGRLEAGAEATYLRVNRTLQTGKRFESQAAPRIWLGYSYDDQWGLRARYWDYRVDAAENFSRGLLSVGPPGFGQQINLTEGGALRAYTVDLEVTRRGYLGNWFLLASLGARYATRLGKETFAFNQIDLSADFIELGNGEIDSEFGGVGLTFALDGERPFGFWNLSLFGNLRGSVIWAQATSETRINNRRFGPDGAGNLVLVSSNPITQIVAFDRAQWIGEAQVGLQWSQPFEYCGGGEVFVRGGLEVQSWSPPRSNGDLTTYFGSAFSAGFRR